MANKNTKAYYNHDFQKFLLWCEERNKDINETSLKSYIVAKGRKWQPSTMRRQLHAIKVGLKNKKISVDLSNVMNYIVRKEAA